MARNSRKKATNDGFPERLRQLRTQKKLSQEDLGQLADLHYNHIGRYERGLSKPSAEKIKALSEALDVSSDYLINGATQDFARARFEDQELLKMFQEIEKYPEEEKNTVKDFLDAFITRKKIHEMAAK